MVKKDILLNGVIVGSHETTGDNKKDAEAVQAFLKEKGLYKKVSKNDAMFGQANSFAAVAISIYKKDLKNSPYKGGSVAPFVVNAVLGTELYLKTIHQAYGHEVRGHHLANIYRRIPKEGKVIFIGASEDLRSQYQLEKGTDIGT